MYEQARNKGNTHGHTEKARLVAGGATEERTGRPIEFSHEAGASIRRDRKSKVGSTDGPFARNRRLVHCGRARSHPVLRDLQPMGTGGRELAEARTAGLPGEKQAGRYCGREDLPRGPYCLAVLRPAIADRRQVRIVAILAGINQHKAGFGHGATRP